MDKKELFWNYAHEQREIGHKLEEQRTAIINFTTLVAGGLITAISLNGFGSQTLFVSVFVTLLGLYGILMTYKIHERMSYHFRRSREFLSELDKLISDGEVTKLKERLDKANITEHPVMAKIPFHQVWAFVNVLILLFGAVSIYLSLPK